MFPALFWAGVVLFFSILPYKGLPSLTIGYFDKILHMFEYLVLAFLLFYGLSKSLRYSGLKRVVLFTLIFGLGYGILMELIQLYVPGRNPSMGDVHADAAGVFFGILWSKVIIWQN